MPDDVTFSVLVRGYGECEPVQWTAISGLLSLMERKYSQPPSISARLFCWECAVWGRRVGRLMLCASPAGCMSESASVSAHLTLSWTGVNMYMSAARTAMVVVCFAPRGERKR